MGPFQESPWALNHRVKQAIKPRLLALFIHFIFFWCAFVSVFAFKASFLSKQAPISVIPLFIKKMKTFTIVAALCLALAISANGQGCPIDSQDVDSLDMDPVKSACGKIFSLFQYSRLTGRGSSLVRILPKALLSCSLLSYCSINSTYFQFYYSPVIHCSCSR